MLLALLSIALCGSGGGGLAVVLLVVIVFILVVAVDRWLELAGERWFPGKTVPRQEEKPEEQGKPKTWLEVVDKDD